MKTQLKRKQDAKLITKKMVKKWGVDLDKLISEGATKTKAIIYDRKILGPKEVQDLIPLPENLISKNKFD